MRHQTRTGFAGDAAIMGLSHSAIASVPLPVAKQESEALADRLVKQYGFGSGRA